MPRTNHRFLPCSLVLLCAFTAPPAAARDESVIPKLDQEGRKGEVARMAQQKASEHFDAGDEDKDGFISKDEAGRHFSYIAGNFERYDKNRDGKLSWEEFIGHKKWKRGAPAK